MMHAHMKMALSTAVILFAVCFCQSLAQQQTTMAANTSTTPMTTMASSMNGSSNGTTSAMSTSTMSTSTMAPTTTTEPPYDLMHMKTAKYELKFTVGQTNASDIEYKGTTALTADSLKTKFETFFAGTMFEMIESMPMPDDNKTYTVVVTFMADNLGNLTMFADKVEMAIQKIENDADFDILDTNKTNAMVEKFLDSTMDICSAMDVCPMGFTCNSAGCEHMCHMEDCSGHGMCILKLLANNTVSTMCNCDDEYDTEYEGDHCETSRRGRDQIIAILAAVLGTACFILLVILIVMCVLQVRKNSKYDMAAPTTHTNQAFVGTQKQ